MTQSLTTKVLIIGAGTGGYVAGIRCGQLGLETVLVDASDGLGGTCLNVGCIPSKAVIHAANKFETVAKAANGGTLGITASKPSVDLKQTVEWKNGIVKKLNAGVAGLLKKAKVKVIKGWATFSDAKTCTVKTDDGEITISAEHVILATGSEPVELPFLPFGGDVISSTEALSLDKVPGKLIVIGAGVIGLELGSVWARLGAKVTVVEYLDRILPGMDSEVARQFQRMLQKQGMEFRLSSKVGGIDKQEDGSLKVRVEPAAGGDVELLDADVALVAIGRKPFTEGLGLDIVGVALDERGRVRVDAHYKSSVDGIYAIGDVVAGPMLAHKAEDEGIAIAEILSGQAGHVNYAAIPSVVYTNPEVASVGKTEDELKADGVNYKIGKFPFTANGRAKAMVATQGFVKILADVETDRVLGAHIVGKNAGEMIHELVTLMEFSGASEDLARTTHAHPTMSEAIREAALALGDGAIHI
jgi:dihydrolipoamide dehydrogenase